MIYSHKAVPVVLLSFLIAVVACNNETAEAASGGMVFTTQGHAIPDNPISMGGSEEARGPVSVTIDALRPFEEADGYTYIEATMRGTVERDDGSEGGYSVPIVLVYPDDGGNGVGVVDWLNTITLHFGGFAASAEEWTPSRYALYTTEDYLFESGFTYVGVQWDKAVTEYFGSSAPDGAEEQSHLIYGTIEQAEDAFEILRHAADFLRDPSALEGAGDLSAVDAVLSFGISQTGALQMEFMSRGENLRNGDLVYDGHLLGKVGLLCLTPRNEPPAYAVSAPCDGPPVEDGAKVIHVAAQGDVEAFFYAGRSRFPENPDWRQYELAGVSHLPVALSPGLDENQNPVSSQPVFRAAFANLARWVTEDIAAPPSRFLEGTLNPDGTFDTDLDEDGNARGGLRLPHMEREADGTLAGAPLGTYSGKNPDADPQAEVLRWIGGHFEPFADEEIAERYPDHETYVRRVARAADHLFEAGYILEEDRDAYVREAENISIGGMRAAGRR